MHAHLAQENQKVAKLQSDTASSPLEDPTQCVAHVVIRAVASELRSFAMICMVKARYSRLREEGKQHGLLTGTLPQHLIRLGAYNHVAYMKEPKGQVTKCYGCLQLARPFQGFGFWKMGSMVMERMG